MPSLAREDDFPSCRQFAYLNTASVSLMHRAAHEAVDEWQADVAQNGTYHFDERAEASILDELHRAAARLVHAAPDDIAVAANATELLGSLAWAILPAAGTNVVSTDTEFPSSTYAFARISRHTGCEIRLARGNPDYVEPGELLGLIDDQTAVVCISHVEYGSGQRFDLKELSDAAHSHGALLVVDATQSAGMVPIDVTAMGVDALVCAGYKWLCGPFGAAFLYLAPRLQSELDPGIVGWRSHRDLWDLRADRLEYPATAHRFEFSTMSYGCAVGLARSIDCIVDIGVDKILEHDLQLTDILVEGLREQGAEILSPMDQSQRSAIVSAQIAGEDSTAVAKRLNAARVVVSARANSIRFSPHLFNDADDIRRALDELARGL